jgi:hypothetical protein
MRWLDDPLRRATCCHMCGGLGYVDGVTTASRTRCPMCGATMHGTSAYDLTWDAKKRRFDLHFALPTPNLGEFTSDLAGRLPGLIAERSLCSCGSSLVVDSHKVTLRDGQVSFQGSFHCPRCSERGSGAIAALQQSIGLLWRTLVRAKRGDSGIEFEGKNGSLSHIQAEQAGAGQSATKPADKAPAEIQPPTPTSKDAPR